MATLVAFHAHPDDETIIQGGSLARAVSQGHRVVIVYATDGEHGEVPDGLLAEGETLVERRRVEAERSAVALGTSRLVWLGYGDSGMMGTDDNDDPGCFWRADVEKAAEMLADVLREERADLLTIYDPNGNYGHPDHIQVHRVGTRAAELAGTPEVLEVTVSREHIRGLIEAAVASGEEVDPNMPDLSDPGITFGMPDEVITTAIDVTAWLDRKRAAMEAHASQIGDMGMFFAMPPEAFAAALGTEFYIRHGAAGGRRDHELFAAATDPGMMSG
ncbi:MAG TPA: PIG-L family deacetylase [Acidimicrobiales bacterium]